MAAQPARRVAADTITGIESAAYRFPTDGPESDGTLDWRATTLVTVHLQAGDTTGFGFSYGSAALPRLIHDTLRPVLDGASALDTAGVHAAAARALRNVGRPGAGAMALSAVDVALWDLKGRLLGASIGDLIGRCRDSVAGYGSGGFTNYDDDRLCAQLSRWRELGFDAVKIKIGRHPDQDPHRVALARRTIGAGPRLMVDANGALAIKQALTLGDCLQAFEVSWFEEPVSSDDLDGLALLRQRLPAPIEVAAGEYGWDARYFERMLAAGAVDVLQADGTRCGGITGLIAADALARAHGVPLSLHCAPALHATAGVLLRSVRDVEYFHDHARLESTLFDGLPLLVDGRLAPCADAPGHGLVLRRREAERYRA